MEHNSIADAKIEESDEKTESQDNEKISRDNFHEKMGGSRTGSMNICIIQEVIQEVRPEEIMITLN